MRIGSSILFRWHIRVGGESIRGQSLFANTPFLCDVQIWVVFGQQGIKKFFFFFLPAIIISISTSKSISSSGAAERDGPGRGPLRKRLTSPIIGSVLTLGSSGSTDVGRAASPILSGS